MNAKLLALGFDLSPAEKRMTAGQNLRDESGAYLRLFWIGFLVGILWSYVSLQGGEIFQNLTVLDR